MIMKSLFLVLILFTSCTYVRKQKGERLIKSYLDTTIGKSISYKSVSTAVDVFWSTPLSNASYLELSNQLSDVKWKLSNLNTEMFLKDDNKKNWDDTTNIILLGIDSADIQKKMKSIADTFKSKPNGWLITHLYKIPNASGKLELHKIAVHVNDDFSKLIAVENR